MRKGFAFEKTCFHEREIFVSYFLSLKLSFLAIHNKNGFYKLNKGTLSDDSPFSLFWSHAKDSLKE